MPKNQKARDLVFKLLQEQLQQAHEYSHILIDFEKSMPKELRQNSRPEQPLPGIFNRHYQQSK